MKEELPQCQETFHAWRMMTRDQYPVFLGEIVNQFVEETGRCLEHVQTAVANGAMQAIREAAHGLNGMTGNEGGDAITTACLGN